LRTLPIFVLALAAAHADDRALVDRVGSTGFVQLEAESFKKLSRRQQALTYWLAQASIAIDPINYDQNSVYGLRQKRLLEAIMLHPDAAGNAQARRRIEDFTKLFWANRGNHNEMTAQKFLPEFSFDDLKTAQAISGDVYVNASLYRTTFEQRLMELKAKEVVYYAEASKLEAYFNLKRNADNSFIPVN